ncbi:hypothetical protein HNY73_007286 [Argiope bruennichi]|uniref:Uncharacterized protein n=1 Tax=Argiope bruennichi TaxID=94029 RepID=A0A8T0FG15_ARGBR|nr:hypothetical protein HNY73_007286 [Argiope bruennichi]
MNSDDEYCIPEDIEDEFLRSIAVMAKNVLNQKETLENIFKKHVRAYNTTLKERCSAKFLQAMIQNHKPIFQTASGIISPRCSGDSAEKITEASCVINLNHHLKSQVGSSTEGGLSFDDAENGESESVHTVTKTYVESQLKVTSANKNFKEQDGTAISVNAEDETVGNLSSSLNSYKEIDKMYDTQDMHQQERFNLYGKPETITRLSFYDQDTEDQANKISQENQTIVAGQERNAVITLNNSIGENRVDEFLETVSSVFDSDSLDAHSKENFKVDRKHETITEFSVSDQDTASLTTETLHRHETIVANPERKITTSLNNATDESRNSRISELYSKTEDERFNNLNINAQEKFNVDGNPANIIRFSIYNEHTNCLPNKTPDKNQTMITSPQRQSRTLTKYTTDDIMRLIREGRNRSCEEETKNSDRHIIKEQESFLPVEKTASNLSADHQGVCTSYKTPEKFQKIDANIRKKEKTPVKSIMIKIVSVRSLSNDQKDIKTSHVRNKNKRKSIDYSEETATTTCSSAEDQEFVVPLKMPKIRSEITANDKKIADVSAMANHDSFILIDENSKNHKKIFNLADDSTIHDNNSLNPDDDSSMDYSSSLNAAGDSTTNGISCFNGAGDSAMNGISSFNAAGDSAMNGISSFNASGDSAMNGISSFKAAGTSATNGISSFKAAGASATNGISSFKAAGTSATNGISSFNASGASATNDISSFNASGASATNDISSFNASGASATNGISSFNASGDSAMNGISSFNVAGESFTEDIGPFNFAGDSAVNAYDSFNQRNNNFINEHDIAHLADKSVIDNMSAIPDNKHEILSVSPVEKFEKTAYHTTMAQDCASCFTAKNEQKKTVDAVQDNSNSKNDQIRINCAVPFESKDVESLTSRMQNLSPSVKRSFDGVSKKTMVNVPVGSDETFVRQLFLRDDLQKLATPPRESPISNVPIPKSDDIYFTQKLKFIEMLKDRKAHISRHLHLFFEDHCDLIFLYEYIKTIATIIFNSIKEYNEDLPETVINVLEKASKLLNKVISWKYDTQTDLKVWNNILEKIQRIHEDIKHFKKVKKRNITLQDLQNWETRFRTLNKTVDDMILLREISRPTVLQFGYELENLIQLFIRYTLLVGLLKPSSRVSSDLECR